MVEAHRLLILACSQRKRPDPGDMRAIDRYDGPAFHVLRRYLRQCTGEASGLDVYIVSAAYGLIPSTHPTICYDQKMTPCRAAELRDEVQHRLLDLLGAGYGGLCLAMSDVYLLALDGWMEYVPPETQVVLTKGPQGAKLAQLKRWLWAATPDEVASEQWEPQQRDHPVLRGVEIRLTAEQVLEAARQALAQGLGDPDNYHAWYVEVGEYRVAPKWLASQLTGLPVSRFHSQEARRVCTLLGMQVCSDKAKEA
ncbi:MAG: hypothetical protein JXM73_24320 [Anaerolineae bacterium]|nr:hypothetical protein [Anaerolineae bacterium]